MTLLVIPENKAITKRERLFGLPRVYAALLLTVSLLVALSFGKPPAAIYLFGFGLVLGRAATYHDPFAWEILGKRGRLPKVLRP